jgi:hypothetical protein
MPHVGPVLEGRTFFCPHCGALYSETPSLVPKSEGDAATCVLVALSSCTDLNSAARDLSVRALALWLCGRPAELVSSRWA